MVYGDEFYPTPTGIQKVNVAPRSIPLLDAEIFPPCASIILREMNRPSPVPFSDFDTNLEKSLGRISESMPRPGSRTETVT